MPHNLLAVIPTDVVQIVDKASAASDRWLFLAAVSFILLGGIVIIRYLVSSNDRQATAHNQFMTTVYTENVKLTAQVLVALQCNNQLLQKLEQLLLEIQARQHP